MYLKFNHPHYDKVLRSILFAISVTLFLLSIYFFPAKPFSLSVFFFKWFLLLNAGAFGFLLLQALFTPAIQIYKHQIIVTKIRRTHIKIGDVKSISIDGDIVSIEYNLGSFQVRVDNRSNVTDLKLINGEPIFFRS